MAHLAGTTRSFNVPRVKPLALVVGFLISVLSAALPSVAFADSGTVEFDIPAQPAPAALKLFMKQSGAQVLFSNDKLQGVTANEVKGAMEPAIALTKLLAGTGYKAMPSGAKNFVVDKAPPAKAATGSIRGNLARENGAPAEGVRVMINETGQQARTDKSGEYIFGSVEPGTFVLVATAQGYQPLHITDVVVKAGNDLTLSKEDMHPADGTLKLEPFVVRAESVTQLEKLEVTGTKEKPFTGTNVDIPRTIDDAQPYYIFDSKIIEQSGATNIEDLLKQRLTMNTTALTNAQSGSSGTSFAAGGNISSINLRGLGADKTLILVNGRRIAGVTLGGFAFQPDINGIPLSAVDRIEVLPSSASGIYGGSAIGGVVNIILKKDYVGGEIRATYDNTWKTDSPTRTVSVSYGFSLEGGKTHVMLNTAWSATEPLLLQDRRGAYDKNLAIIQKNSPTFLFSSSTPFLGATPNIINTAGTYNSDYSVFIPDNLILKNGTSLNSGITYVPAGTSNTTSSAALNAGLIANAGSWNLNLPLSTQAPTGLLLPFGSTPTTKSFQVSVRRQMLPKLEVFADYSYNENYTKSVANPNSTSHYFRSSYPANPFTTAVYVSGPDAAQVPLTTQSVNRGFTAGAIAELPRDWTSEFDYSWSQNRYKSLYYFIDTDARRVDLMSGEINPFVDSLLYPIDSQKYLAAVPQNSASVLNDFALRGSGPLPTLPWGIPNLTLGLEYRIEGTPDYVSEQNFPITTTSDVRYTYFGRQQKTASGYGEATIPLLKKDWLPLVHGLDLQLSGRSERYTVDTGTPYYSEYPNNPAYTALYGGYGYPNLNGQRYSTKATYTSTNGTTGLRYQPIPEITIRASLATAFLPPTPAQLLKNPQIDSYTTTINDPKTGNTIDVQTSSGGNPGLTPQSSKSLNAGIIWEPRARLLKGLRMDVEYYRIEQDNAVASLTAQQIVNQENTYLGRVTRDASGNITLVDTSLVNLYKLKTEGWDLSADYTLKTDIGSFNLAAVESIISHLRTQYSLTLPEYESAGYSPGEGGSPKYKSNATLTWEWRGWSAAWTTRYISSYKQYGAEGGPDAVQNYSGAADPYAGYIPAQGSDAISSQTYHDLFFSYSFSKNGEDRGSGFKVWSNKITEGLTVQLGVRNIFDKAPPLDAFYASTYYESPFGDMRLRSYWLSVRKSF